MPSPDNKPYGTKKLTTLAVFLAITLALGFIERIIPFDIAVPGVRLGLANVVILLLLFIYKPAWVFAVVILKCILTSVLWGSGASFIYSICGSLLSFFVMLLLIKFGGKKISPVGISVAGAVFHNTGQILAAWFMLGTFQIIAYLPVLLLSGVITGIITGTAVKYLRVYITRII